MLNGLDLKICVDEDMKFMGNSLDMLSIILVYNINPRKLYPQNGCFELVMLVYDEVTR